MLPAMKTLITALLLLVLAGCSSGLRIDRSHPSANQDSRIQFVVVHYTNASLERSLALLTHGEVSSHYLIGDGPATVYQLVDENRRAWHAGDSQWQGRTWLNSSSIGIEIVNEGYTDTPTGRVWHPYSEAQVQSLIALLKDIVKRNNIDPRHIIGHSDIAPLRKLDPGPLFPWKRLAEAGLGVWPDSAAVARQQAFFEVNPPSISWYQQQLSRFGYAIDQTGELDVATRHVIAAFQMRFRPRLFDGTPDAQTAAMLQVLNRKR
ncbi:N-acetylmuramoyl-L-alanine amidase [Pseudomonas sp. FW305-17]|uniref:N-acetylmuramoyl-L-alanine amidase n=2 Tax=Pseudomonas TaxID=286 RepID=UPI000C87E1E9|nr:MULTISPECIES: N-acetylmuramoyl-L-alanine amidase [Pseudomonas]PMZ98426.1 N-acetylmuramoyl-L-alanine amidase [Pseudomonas sp. FW305-42]PNA28436.1 N-acetylmuramoyl-L-alanine amidase [Pseudomonas sp. MPR-R1B]PNB28865.1 N-acetylmuramoyl-L-alanine amidase [Pseudomonas sp. DP16D-E2]PNB45727.1 N-acetylmuramoyl-L-alanine amidase [Pseudomonas sp. FW305-17]PNB64592.1 N-acetylmuramoyl-L-alanine amidase [Pseudomonas sp. GW531-E2]